MRYYSSSSDFYYDTTKSTLNYYITVNGETIYNGKAVKSPSKDAISIDVGKRVRDYIRINMPDFRDYDGVVVPHPEAMLVFNLYDSQSGEVLEQYNVRIDDTKEWSGEEGCLSEPINTHADPRQKIFYGYSSENGADIDVDAVNYEGQYLTLVVLSGGTIVASGGPPVQPTQEEKLYYSLDEGATWTPVAWGGNYVINVNAGDRVLLKNEGAPTSRLNENGTAYFNVEGNIMSLNYKDNFVGQKSISGGMRSFFKGTNVVSAKNLVLPATALTDMCYFALFSGCTSLTTPPDVLPAASLADYCYESMFQGCNSLKEPPKLPATELADYCYQYMFHLCGSLTKAPSLPAKVMKICCYRAMFSDCTSLTKPPRLPSTVMAKSCYSGMFNFCTSLETAPELPATTLADSCYYNMFHLCRSLTSAPRILPATELADYCYDAMFSGCDKLTTAPELPALALVLYCYRGMFFDCSKLNYIKAMFIEPQYNYTENWVDGVASSGIFVQNSSATWDFRGASGIPSGWTVQTASS